MRAVINGGRMEERQEGDEMTRWSFSGYLLK
jgi:hypothetical protein